MNLSPELYEEFSVPYDSRLLERFGGGCVHFCCRGDHYIELLAKIPKMYAVQMSQPQYNDMEKILDISINDERKIAFESLNYTIPESLKDNKDIIEKDNILIIYGTKEDLNCTKSAIDLKSIFTNAKLVEIIRGNHLWNIIDHDLFNTIIRNFIRDHHIEDNSKINILE